MSCAAERLRYRRLVRLPTVRALGIVALGTAVAAGTAAIAAPAGGWAVAAVVSAGVLVAAGYAVSHRARICLEWRLVGALREAGGCGDAVVDGLSAPVRVGVHSDGTTRVEAGCWADAMRGLGYVMARDRAFQLDLLRRTARGRLAAVFGPAMLPVDRRYRWLGLGNTARAAAAGLEEPEREVLTAFADGVNAAGMPYEARFLSYRPAPWTVEDSLVIALYLSHSLSWNEPAKRAEAVVRYAFAPDVAAFLLGGTDPPPGGLAGVRTAGDPPAGLVSAEKAAAGSNCWIRSGPDGPVLACDLHLPLTLPNLLYQVDVAVPGRRVRGLAAAGLPVVLAGTNGRIGWGVTNLTPDALDLVPVGADVVSRTERIRVRGAPEVAYEVRSDGGMPVLENPLPTGEVAARWAGFDPRSCDLRFQRLAWADDVAGAIAALDTGQGTPLNVLVADADGHLAHVAVGLLLRRSRNGSGVPGAPAFLAPDERPRLVDPPDGLLVSANDDALPGPWRIGYDLDPGFRARRLRAALADMSTADVAAMRELQHDTAADLYRPYRDLAVAALRGRNDTLARRLAGWDGHAEVRSTAFAVLVRFRQVLAGRVLGTFLATCREHDPAFEYALRGLDRPVLAIVRSADPTLLPPDAEAAGWPAFVADCVARAVRDLGGSPRRWGRLNRVGLNHPLTLLAGWSDRLTRIRAVPQAGALHSVRTCAPGFAAAGRVVVAPRFGAAVFDTPGGQSGHPLSRHYADRHQAWADRHPRPEKAARPECTHTLRPPSSDR